MFHFKLQVLSIALSDLLLGAFIGGVILIIVKLIKSFRKKLLTSKGNTSTIGTMSSNAPSSKVSLAEKSQGTATNSKLYSECGAAVQSLNTKFCTECGNKLK